MFEASPSRRRRSIIEALEGEAIRLIATAAAESIKAEVRRAVTGLDEARYYLAEYDAHNRVYVLAIVDLNIQLAQHRLQDISQAIVTASFST
jgi:hypothetical protein